MYLYIFTVDLKLNIIVIWIEDDKALLIAIVRKSYEEKDTLRHSETSNDERRGMNRKPKTITALQRRCEVCFRLMGISLQ